MASELNLATASAQAVDMSVFGLFMMADPVVKAVMLLLVERPSGVGPSFDK